MRIVYTAPNRAHHYRYARYLHQSGNLEAFVSGFSRFGTQAKMPELGERLVRADTIQNVYLASLRLRTPAVISDELSYLAKLEQDRRCRAPLNNANLFLFYNGCGLSSLRHFQKRGGINVVEVVNSHVFYQEDLLREEYRIIQQPWRPFHRAESMRRSDEYDEADYIVVPSEFSKCSFISRGYPENKLIKVTYGFESSIECGALEVDPLGHGLSVSGSLSILYVGSISVRRNVLRYLIQAFDKLEHPRKKLTIVGPVSSPSGLENLRIPDGVTFTGVLRGKQLSKAYQNADVFCLPTIEDGFGLVIGEALSTGIPVIATENSGGPDIITENVDGFIVPIRNPDAIKEKLQELADSPTKLQAMKRNAASMACTLPGWVGTKKTLIESLTSIASDRQNPPS